MSPPCLIQSKRVSHTDRLIRRKCPVAKLAGWYKAVHEVTEGVKTWCAGLRVVVVSIAVAVLILERISKNCSSDVTKKMFAAEKVVSFGTLASNAVLSRLPSATRIARHSIPGDYTLQKYHFQEKFLYLTLPLTTLASFVLFGIALWARNDEIGMLMYYLKDGIRHIEEKSHKMFINDKHIFGPDLLKFADMESKEFHLGRWARILSDLQLTVVLLMWTSSIAGILVLHEKQRVFAVAFIVSNIVNIFIELIVAPVFLVSNLQLHTGIKAQMVDIFHTDYREGTDSVMTRLLNTIMVVGKCCGIQGPEDFERAVTLGYISTHRPSVARACCLMETWGLTIQNPNRNVQIPLLLCVSRGIQNNTMIHPDGCFETWGNIFIQETYTSIVVITTVVCSLQLAQAIIGVLILKFTEFVVDPEYKPRSSMSVNAYK